MSAVTELIERLTAEGYCHAGTDILSDDARVSFDAIMTPPNGRTELLVIQSETHSHLPDTRRKLKKLILLLRRADSLRSFTLTPVAPGFDDGALAELEAYARVVPIKADGPWDAALSQLRPLKLPEPLEPNAPVLERLYRTIPSTQDTDFIRRLIKCANNSPDAVRQAFLSEVDTELSKFWTDQ